MRIVCSASSCSAAACSARVAIAFRMEYSCRLGRARARPELLGGRLFGARCYPRE